MNGEQETPFPALGPSVPSAQAILTKKALFPFPWLVRYPAMSSSRSFSQAAINLSRLTSVLENAGRGVLNDSL